MGRQLLKGAAGAILSLVVGTTGFAADRTQLARSAGLTPAEAAGMTLDAIAAHKFSREGNDSEQPVVTRAEPAYGHFQLLAAAGISRAVADPGLDAIYVRLINRSGGADEQQAMPAAPGRPDPAARRQLAASAGISPEEAAGLTLGAIAVRKFNRESDGDERIVVIE